MNFDGVVKLFSEDELVNMANNPGLAMNDKESKDQAKKVLISFNTEPQPFRPHREWVMASANNVPGSEEVMFLSCAGGQFAPSDKDSACIFTLTHDLDGQGQFTASAQSSGSVSPLNRWISKYSF